MDEAKSVEIMFSEYDGSCAASIQPLPIYIQPIPIRNTAILTYLLFFHPLVIHFPALQDRSAALCNVPRGLIEDWHETKKGAREDKKQEQQKKTRGRRDNIASLSG